MRLPGVMNGEHARRSPVDRTARGADRGPLRAQSCGPAHRHHGLSSELMCNDLMGS
jgi:hypothetical protein